MKTTPVSADALRRLMLFGRLPAEILSDVAAQITTIRLERLRTLQLEKSRGGYVYVLVSGVAALNARHNSFGPMFRGIITAGEVFNLGALLPEQASLQCKALTDCVIARLRPKTFSELVVGVPLEKFRLILESALGDGGWGLPPGFRRPRSMRLAAGWVRCWWS